jgi:hypothetical protein
MTMSYAGANPRIHRSSSNDFRRTPFQKQMNIGSAEKSAQSGNVCPEMKVASIYAAVAGGSASTE